MEGERFPCSANACGVLRKTQNVDLQEPVELQEPAAGAGCVTSSPTFLQWDGLGGSLRCGSYLRIRMTEYPSGKPPGIIESDSCPPLHLLLGLDNPNDWQRLVEDELVSPFAGS